MSPHTIPNLSSEYAVVSSRDDEKRLIEEIERVFERRVPKAMNSAMLAARKPFLLAYYYQRRDASDALYIEVLPNRDMNGRLQVPEAPDCGWIIRTSVLDGVPVDAGQTAAKARERIDRLSFPTRLVR